MSDQPSINYLIATYAGVSKKREIGDKGITPYILQIHLEKLISLLPTTTLIKQITIMRPKVVGCDVYKEYYKIENYIEEINGRFNIPVKFVDMDNYYNGVSYSQYRHAFKEHPNFDLYMLMEDDWIPVQEQFDQLLLTEWRKHFKSTSDKGYLCMWYAAIMKFMNHAAISVGLVSRSAFQELQSRCQLNVELDQYNFSLVLEHIGCIIKDFSNGGNNWRILFWESNNGVIYDFSSKIKDKECLLVPLQFTLRDTHNYEIVPRQY